MTELGREKRHWEVLAQSDPMWIILTDAGKEGRWSSEEFFDSGRREVASALALLRERFGVTPRPGTALDFGCGLGRLTQGLAGHFERAVGVDISSAMVEQARAHNRHGARVEYHANATDGLPMLADGSVDFVYSRLVLQHIPREVAERYLAEFARVLAPGGVAMFQAMTRARRWPVRVRHMVRDAMPDLYRWLRDLVARRSRWEMNTIGEGAVRRIMAAGHMNRVESYEDAPDPEFESRMFVCTRAANP